MLAVLRVVTETAMSKQTRQNPGHASGVTSPTYVNAVGQPTSVKKETSEIRHLTALPLAFCFVWGFFCRIQDSRRQVAASLAVVSCPPCVCTQTVETGPASRTFPRGASGGVPLVVAAETSEFQVPRPIDARTAAALGRVPRSGR